MKTYNIVMLDDGLGFGDFIACCPVCGNSITVPIGYKGTYTQCSTCGVTICLKEEENPDGREIS